MEHSSMPEGQQAAPGWYKDPTTGNDRYWDGTQWAAEQQAQKSAVGGLEIAGYITAVLFSIAGLIIGIIVTARGNTLHGVLIMVIAVISMVLGYLLVYG